jgi:hypothetical protein
MNFIELHELQIFATIIYPISRERFVYISPPVLGSKLDEPEESAEFPPQDTPDGSDDSSSTVFQNLPSFQQFSHITQLMIILNLVLERIFLRKWQPFL